MADETVNITPVLAPAPAEAPATPAPAPATPAAQPGAPGAADKDKNTGGDRAVSQSVWFSSIR